MALSIGKKDAVSKRTIIKTKANTPQMSADPFSTHARKPSGNIKTTAKLYK